MAIPNNYIDKITKDDESRLICPAAHNVRVDNENYDGADLDVVLDEIAESVEAKADSADVYTQAEVRARLPLRITVTTIGGVITSSHEYSEIDNAVREDKRDAYVVFDGNVYNLCQISQSYITFSFVDAEGGAQTMLSININNAWSVEDVPISSEGGYTPPQGGIPKTDLAPAVQASLGKADTAVQPAALNSGLAGKVDKETGKGLSKNDYTDADKAAVATIGDKADADDVYTKAEVDTKISQAGGGTVTGVRMNGTVKEPSSGVVDLGTVITQHQDISGKVDKVTGKGLSTNDYTDAEKTKLAGIAAGAEVNVQPDWSQTNTSAKDFIKNKPTIPDVSDLATKAELQDATPSISQGGYWIVGGVETDVKAEGQDGNSGVGNADNFESVNNLNGGTTDTVSKVYVLGANQGKKIKDQFEYVYSRVKLLYSLFAGIAFEDDAPLVSSLFPDLEWGNPKHTVTLSLSLTNAIVKHNGVAKSNGDTIQVEEGSTLELTVEAESGYRLSSVSSVAGDVDNNVVSITMGSSNVTLDITASATQIVYKSVSWNGTGFKVYDAASGGSVITSPQSVIEGEQFEAWLVPDGLYSISSVSGATYDSSTGKISIASVTADTSITVSTSQIANPMYKGVGYYPHAGAWSYLSVGDGETRYITPLIDISGVQSNIKIPNRPSNNKGCIAYFDDNLEYLTFHQKEWSAVRTIQKADIPAGARYIRYTEEFSNIANDYVEIDGVKVFDGSTYDTSTALTASDFLVSNFCPGKVASAVGSGYDYLGWLFRKNEPTGNFNNDYIDDNTKYDHFGDAAWDYNNFKSRGNNDAVKDAQIVMVTTVGSGVTRYEIQFGIGNVIDLPTDRYVYFSCGESGTNPAGAAATGSLFEPYIQLINSETGKRNYYTLTSDVSAVNQTTKVRKQTVVSSAGFNKVCMTFRLTAYEQHTETASLKQPMIVDSQGSSILWKSPYATDQQILDLVNATT